MASPPLSRSDAGFSLPELLVVGAVLATLGGLCLTSGQRWLEGRRLEAALRLVLVGLDRGRLAAELQGRPCALSLSAAGWQPPTGGLLPACLPDLQPLQESLGGGITLDHNFPAQVRFSANGLLLDGGTVRLQQPGSRRQRCLVVALPLGITRMGEWQEGACVPG